MDFENLEVDQSSYLDEINIVVYKDTNRRLSSSRREHSKGFNTTKISCNTSNKDLLCKSLKRTKTNHKHPCPICRKMFKTLVQMKHHLISHSVERLYSCKGCKYRAKHRQSLHFHIRHSHPGTDAKTLFKGPTDSDFEALAQNVAKSINSSWNESRDIEVDNSTADVSEPQSEFLQGFILEVPSLHVQC
ncbi:hypothetical protein J437_LFUL005260 [Ladona fulva]|uniref:C2H2-type domain-containing protein n=1 Tax=Ladona fulva TaxID=123851 RepID=A0A8K0NVR2_LADFU|nr:hypothetical protein J437_LFUL005260 [Ladona fulva]